MAHGINDPALPPPGSYQARQNQRVAALEAELRALRATLQGGSLSQIPVVDTLPASGRQGRLIMLRATSAIYKDTGAGWVTPP